MDKQRKWQEYSNEEKLIAIEAYLDGMNGLQNADLDSQNAHLQWVREHVPSYKADGGQNYVFISYSHRDFAKVYRDLSAFLYNSYKKVRFWYDEGLPAGKNWAEEAKRYIEHPNCVGAVFYLSENLLNSSAVLQEIQMIEKSGKPYVAVALDKEKFSASRILKDRSDKNFALLDKFFPDADTALIYDEEYENILYRINKIEETFNVTEDVLSDFICEEYGEGLNLVEYKGSRTEVFIPEKINDKPVVAISASFDNAESIYLSKNIRYIFSPVLKEDTYEDAKNKDTATIYRLCEMMLGGYQKKSAPFGSAPNLIKISVDNANPYFYDKDGALYSKDGAILRLPPKNELKESHLEGVKKIGDGALYGCYSKHEGFDLDGIEEIGENAFAQSEMSIYSFGSTLRVLSPSAFWGMQSRFPIADITGELLVVDDWCFKDTQLIKYAGITDGVIKIGKGAFFGSMCHLVSFPSTLKEIGVGAFASSALELATIPEGTEYIGNLAFYNCEQLETVQIPASVKYIGGDAFFGCDALRYIRYKGKRKQLAQIKTSGEGPSEEFMKKIVCKDERWRRFRLWIRDKIRGLAEKILEKV